MKVRDLISQLQEVDPDLDVFVETEICLGEDDIKVVNVCWKNPHTSEVLLFGDLPDDTKGWRQVACIAARPC
jgi:hypothetical protein